MLFCTRSDFRFWCRWIIANLIGELLGLGVVATAAYAAVSVMGESASAAHALAFATLIIGLGIIEGAIVGYAQAVVLRRRLPQLRAWVRATMVGAACAWSLGMLPGTLMSIAGSSPSTMPSGMSDALQLLLAVPLGLVTGAILGLPQWLVLKRYVSRAGWWVAANAAAWACGMPLIFAVAGAGAPGPVLPTVIVVLAGLALAGALVGAVHGAFLIKLLASSRALRSAG